MEDLYAKLADILEVDALKPDDTLASFEAWDSLGVLSVIAMLDASYGIHMTALDLRNIGTAGELVQAIAKRKGQ
jgi:acyl carrier protein